MSFSGGSTELRDILLPSQRHLLDQIIGEIRGQIGQPGTVYGGQVVPGAAPLQEQVFGQIGALAGPATAGYERALSGLPAYEIDPAAREAPYGAIEQQALGQLRKQLPYLEERYNAMGAGRSGGLQHAMAQAAGDLSLGLGVLRGQYEYQDELARRQAAESAAMRQFGAAGPGLQTLMSAGGVQRGIAGEQMGEAYNKWLMGQPWANPWLGFMPQALGTQAFTPVTQQWGFGLT